LTLSNRMSRTRAIAAIFAALFLMAEIPVARPRPVPASMSYPLKEAFERYVTLTDERNAEELTKGMPFLWVDALPQALRSEKYAAMKRGEVLVERLETLDSGNAIQCPGGLLHHWVGTLWIPGATLPQTLALVQAYVHLLEVCRT
jgi:hypothetical protein